MDWQQLDSTTKAALIALGLAVLGMMVPPIGMAFALLAIVLSGYATMQAYRAGSPNRVALICLGASAALIALVVAGNAIYAASA